MRSLTVGLLVALSATHVAQAQEEDWFPLAPGNTWTYVSRVTVEVEVGPFGEVEKKLETPLEVTAVCGVPREIDGHLFYPLRWSDNTGALDARTWVRCEGMRIYLAKSIGGRLLLLPGDLGGGKGVRGEFEFSDYKVKLKHHSVGKRKWIKTPSGKHHSIPVSSKLKLNSFQGSTLVWYAQGLGPVVIKERIKVAGTDTEHRLQLKSFTRGIQINPQPEPPPYADPRAQPVPQPQPQPHPDSTPRPDPQPEPHVVPRPDPQPTTDPLAGPDTRHVLGGGSLQFVRELVATGNPASWRLLESLTAEATRRSGQLGLSITRADLPQAQLVVRGHSTPRVLDDVLLVSEGAVSSGSLDDCVVYVNGDVTVTGNVLGSIVVCTGRVTVSGTVKNSLILSRGAVSVHGYAKHTVFQALSVTAPQFSKECIYVTTPRRVGQSKGDVDRPNPRPLDVFDGR